MRRAVSLGVRFACGEEVTEVQHDDNGFLVSSVYKDEKGQGGWLTEARFLILAAGGKAGPSFGTTGDGYRLAKMLGHSIVVPVPALTGIECAEWDEGSPTDAHVLAGTRTAGVVSLYKRNFPELPCYDGPFFRGEYSNMKPVFIERGEIQFTKYGLSGICVFNMTRHMRLSRAREESFADFFIKTDLFPDGNISDYIFDLQKGPFSGMPLREMLCTVLKEPLAGYVTGVTEENSSIGRDRPVSKLNFGDISFICEIVHGLEFSPEGLRGWKDAQVTMGGVPETELFPSTSESRLVEGLYITGELADRDFQCGGFNLSNAWLTGMHAAEDISGRLQR